MDWSTVAAGIESALERAVALLEASAVAQGAACLVIGAVAGLALGWLWGHGSGLRQGSAAYEKVMRALTEERLEKIAERWERRRAEVVVG